MGSNGQAAQKQSKHSWVFAVAAFLVILLLWQLIPYGYAYFTNRRGFEKVMAFQPSEETYITIQVSTGDCLVKEIRDLGQQREIAALTSQLTFGGHYTRWGHMPFQKHRLTRSSYGDGPDYTVILRTKNVDDYGYIDVYASGLCMGGGHSNQYPAKYDNYEALYAYCDELFADIAPATLDTRFPAMADNDLVWVKLSDHSTLNGQRADLSLVVSTIRNYYVQVISCEAHLNEGTTLADLSQDPTRYVRLEDTNGDGYDDLTVLIDEAAGTYHTYLWDAENERFAA